MEPKPSYTDLSSSFPNTPSDYELLDMKTSELEKTTQVLVENMNPNDSLDCIAQQLGGAQSPLENWNELPIENMHSLYYPFVSEKLLHEKMYNNVGSHFSGPKLPNEYYNSDSSSSSVGLASFSGNTSSDQQESPKEFFSTTVFHKPPYYYGTRQAHAFPRIYEEAMEGRDHDDPSTSTFSNQQLLCGSHASHIDLSNAAKHGSRKPSFRHIFPVETTDVDDNRPPNHIEKCDPGIQEQLKLKRKREKNRIAAARCRRKKLERLQVESDRLTQLEQEFQLLVVRRKKLEKESTQLKYQVFEHLASGCNIESPIS